MARNKISAEVGGRAVRMVVMGGLSMATAACSKTAASTAEPSAQAVGEVTTEGEPAAIPRDWGDGLENTRFHLGLLARDIRDLVSQAPAECSATVAPLRAIAGQLDIAAHQELMMDSGGMR